MNKQRSLWIVMGLTVLNAVGMTIVFPLFPFLIGQYVPEARVAAVMGGLVSVFALCQFFAAPLFGALSDRYGRKPILIVSLLGSAIGYALLGIGGALWILFLGRIIDGLTAGNQSALFAYIADVTEPAERSRWYGLLGGAIGVGFMIGPAIGGLLGSKSTTLPFFVTAGLTVISILLTAALVHESLPPEKRTRRLSLEHLNTFGHFREIFSLKEPRALIVVGAFFYVGLNIWQFNATLFLKDVYRWGPSLIGGIFVLVGICDILSRVVLLPYLLKKWSERSLSLVGLLGLATGTALICASVLFPSGPVIIVAVACIVLGEGLFDPSYNARLSLSVVENKQGLLQGVNQSLQALYRVLVPLGAAAVYTYSHGAVFGFASVLLLIGFGLFARLAVKAPVKDADAIRA